jgi:hypothetical protein
MIAQSLLTNEYSPSIESHAQGGIALGQHLVEGDGIVPVSQPIHAALRSVVHRLGLVALSEIVRKIVSATRQCAFRMK